jgi:hypothetical protein
LVRSVTIRFKPSLLEFQKFYFSDQRGRGHMYFIFVTRLLRYSGAREFMHVWVYGEHRMSVTTGAAMFWTRWRCWGLKAGTPYINELQCLELMLQWQTVGWADLHVDNISDMEQNWFAHVLYSNIHCHNYD